MKIFVVIPAYRCKAHILEVIRGVPQEVSRIIVVDDSCPEATGKYVQESCTDPRLVVLFHSVNQGVGGAMLTGYQKALDEGAEIVVKLDGDGQMNPALIPQFVGPIQSGLADYAKGNRFTQVEHMKEMPIVRLIGNLGLSFINKTSSGYWKVLDPTNGYTAIHRSALKALPFHKIQRRYFFESDMLFRLNLIDALVLDIPMESVYGNEVSNLKVGKSLIEFSQLHFQNFFKRLIYRYFILDFNMASLELVFGMILLLFGFIFGAYHWEKAYELDRATPTGTIMIAVLSILVGFQFLISFIGFDISREPKVPLSRIRNPFY